MVSHSRRALTKISFRRDVRIFLTALGCFFAVLVAVLLLLLQRAVTDARTATYQRWNVVADMAAGEIADTVADGRASNAGIVLTALTARYPIAGSDLALASGQRFRVRPMIDGGTTLTRSGAWGTLHLVFDDAPLASLGRHVALTTSITAAATAAALVLLLLYIPRIVRPIEQLLDQAAEVEERHPAVDEQSYLLDTFRKTVATLKEQQEQLRALHDQQKSRADDLDRVTAALTRGMTSGMLAIDPNGTVIEINQAGRDILRMPASEPFMAGSVENVLGSSGFAAFVRQALEQRAPLTRRETEAISRNGERAIIGVTSVPLVNDDGGFLGMIVLFTDLTSIRVLEARLRESQTLADLGEMSAGIAHEFRNSLSTILGYLKLAQRQNASDEILPKVRKAEEEAAQLSAAVESLLAFAKPVKLQLQHVDLRRLVEEIIGRMEPATPNVTFTIHGDATAEADPALLTRAIQNIVRNAIESIEAKQSSGRVAIDIDGERQSITISDDGIGIRAEEAARFFLPFHSDKAGGFGLGLPLAKKVVVLHGGTIRMSGEPGRGATVVMELNPGGGV